MIASIDNQPLAKEAFNRQSFVFDELYVKNKIVAYKRERTRNAFESQLKKGAKILELNAGTGQDALYFASKGYAVHATDISNNMLDELKKKLDILFQEQETMHKSSNHETFTMPTISVENISFEDLDKLADKGPYDGIFSNFGGLNCTKNLNKVLDSFSELLNPNAVVTLVVMPSFCLWEFLLVFRGAFKLAFRRLFSKQGAKAHIEGVHFLCYYYSPQYIIKHLKEDFELVHVEGLCTIVPPSYIENFPNKFPKIFQGLKNLENKWKQYYPFNTIGDYYIISLKKIKREG
ncbi:MAG: methyltransferase domain-containing protein [Bacteroidetes bacterium]|nr:methyltransferase domain-containing protein [Bacteroidota bacterium]